MKLRAYSRYFYHILVGVCAGFFCVALPLGARSLSRTGFVGALQQAWSNMTRVHAAIGGTINVNAPMYVTSTNTVTASTFQSADGSYYLNPAGLPTSLVTNGKVGIGVTGTAAALEVNPGDAMGRKGVAVRLQDGADVRVTDSVLGGESVLYNDYGQLVISAPLFLDTSIEYMDIGTSTVPAQSSDRSSVYVKDSAVWSKDDQTGPHNLYVDEFSWDVNKLSVPNGGTTSWYMIWLDLDNAQNHGFEYTVSSPYGWGGKTVYCDLYWICSLSNCTGNVRWNLYTRSFADNSNSYQTSYHSYATTAGRANFYMVKSTLTLTWPSGGQQVVIRVYRRGSDALDTLNSNIRLKGARCRIWN